MTDTHADPIIPSDQEATLAREACRALELHHAADQSLRVQVGAAGREVTTLELPPAVAKLLMQMLAELGKGRAVTLVPTEAEITTQQAADLLNVSRPFVVGLVDKGELPARMIGSHRRVLLRDVLAYKAGSKARARGALTEMVAISQDLGLE